MATDWLINSRCLSKIVILPSFKADLTYKLSVLVSSSFEVKIPAMIATNTSSSPKAKFISTATSHI